MEIRSPNKLFRLRRVEENPVRYDIFYSLIRTCLTISIKVPLNNQICPAPTYNNLISLHVLSAFPFDSQLTDHLLCFQLTNHKKQHGRTPQHPTSRRGRPPEERPPDLGRDARGIQAAGHAGVAHQPQQSLPAHILRPRTGQATHLQEPGGHLHRVHAELPRVPEPAQPADVLQTGRLHRVRRTVHAVCRTSPRVARHARVADPALRMQVDHCLLHDHVHFVHGRPLQPIADGRNPVLGPARARHRPLVGVEVRVRHAAGRRLRDVVRGEGGDDHREVLWHLLHGHTIR